MFKVSLLCLMTFGCAVDATHETSSEAPGSVYNASERSVLGEVARDAVDALHPNIDRSSKRSLVRCQVDYVWMSGCLLINTFCTKNGVDYDLINQDLKCPPVFLMPRVKYSDPPIEP